MSINAYPYKLPSTKLHSLLRYLSITLIQPSTPVTKGLPIIVITTTFLPPTKLLFLASYSYKLPDSVLLKKLP